MTTVGLCLPQLGPYVDRQCIRQFCVRAEQLGFSSLWVQEHLFYPHDPPDRRERPTLGRAEQYRSVFAATELLAAAAAWTERVTIGTSVLIAGYHRPVETAQRLATLDRLSGGRLVAGFGVGWSEPEHRQMDIDPRTRGDRCEEFIDAVLACWGPDPVAFDGRWFSIPQSDVNPKPLQQPRPPLLSGMASDQGLQRTVRQFDIWNPVGSVERAVARWHEMNAHRAPANPLRLFLRIFVELPGAPSETPSRAVEALHAVIEQAARAGVEVVIVDPNFWSLVESPTAWATVPDRLAELVSSAAAASAQSDGASSLSRASR